MNTSGSLLERCGRYTRQPGSALRTTPACSCSSAASASPLPFAARIFATTVSTFAIALALLVRLRLRGCCHHVLVAVAARDQLRMLEDVDGRLERRPRDLHMRRPAAEPLVGGDGRGQDRAVDPGKER